MHVHILHNDFPTHGPLLVFAYLHEFRAQNLFFILSSGFHTGFLAWGGGAYCLNDRRSTIANLLSKLPSKAKTNFDEVLEKQIVILVYKL